MLLNDFSGGYNSRIAAHLLPNNQAQEYNNIDATSGSLRSVKGNIDTGVVINEFFTWYYAKNKWYSRSIDSDFIEFREKLYVSDGTKLKVYDGSSLKDVGILEPSNILTISVTTPTTEPTENTYSYVYTYYNSITGIESKPSLPSNEVTGALDITIDGFQASTQNNNDTYRLYRIGGGLTQYTLVKELSYTTSSTTDTTTTDLELAGNHILDTINDDIPPIGLKYITEAYAMLFGAVNDKLYFSSIARPHAWPVFNYIDFDGPITGIGAIASGILVFTKFKTYIITGNTPGTLSKFLLDGSLGCLSHKSIQALSGSIIWLSNNGLSLSNGNGIQTPTLSVIENLNIDTIYSSALVDGVYYLSYYTALGTKIVAYDNRYNSVLKFIDGFGKYLQGSKSNLYQYNNGTLSQLLVGSPIPIKYRSPILTEGSYTNYKTYKDFYIKYNGNFTLQIFIDSVKVLNKSIEGNSCYNAKSLGLSKGYGLEFVITGIGEVSEIQYTAIGRQNDK